MKVTIGKYKNYFGCYQLAGLLEKVGFTEETADAFAEQLIYLKVDKILDFIDTKRNRVVKVRIDEYDTWNMDGTLALIIIPMLRQLIDTKHGSPTVEAEDAPSDITDVHDRWDYVIKEMLWAFENMDETDQFYEEIDPSIDFKAADINEQIKNIKYDEEGLDKHYKRVANGFRLFGLYYQGLWD